MMMRWIKRKSTQTSEMKLVDKEKVESRDIFNMLAEKYGIVTIG